MELSLLFKIFGDIYRLRIMNLMLNSELCVCDIESVLKMSQANASRHLAKMKITGILSSRKDAQWVYYAINKKFTEEHPEIIESLKAEFKRHAIYKDDMKYLAVIQKRKKEISDLKCRKVAI